MVPGRGLKSVILELKVTEIVDLTRFSMPDGAMQWSVIYSRAGWGVPGAGAADLGSSGFEPAPDGDVQALHRQHQAHSRDRQGQDSGRGRSCWFVDFPGILWSRVR